MTRTKEFGAALRRNYDNENENEKNPRRCGRAVADLNRDDWHLRPPSHGRYGAAGITHSVSVFDETEAGGVLVEGSEAKE